MMTSQGGDGDSEYTFEMNGEHNETIVISSDSEEDEPVFYNNETVVISSDSEEDEPVFYNNETVVISSDSEEDEPVFYNNETVVISSDSEGGNPIPNDEGAIGSEDDEPIPDREDDDSIPSGEETTSEEDAEQTGRGVKRKAQNQHVEQEQDYYYQIEPGINHHSQKFNMMAKNYGVHFNNALDNVDLLESRNRTYGIFERLIEDVTEGMNPTDQVRFVLRSDQLQTPISIPFCPLEELTVEKVLSNVEKVVQSNEDFRLNDTVTINIIHVEMPRGSGRLKRTTLNIRDHLKKKQSVILINNKDDFCLARALVVSIARIEKDPRYKQIKEARGRIQRRKAFDLHQAANVPLGPCGLKEVDLFQRYLV